MRWSSEWVIRLGDGTEESKQRIENALNELWSYTEEMFSPADYETECAKNKIGVDVSSLKKDWNKKVKDVFKEAHLHFLLQKQNENTNGKKGNHTEHLQEILNEMQYLQRAYPGCEW